MGRPSPTATRLLTSTIDIFMRHRFKGFTFPKMTDSENKCPKFMFSYSELGGPESSELHFDLLPSTVSTSYSYFRDGLYKVRYGHS